MMSLGVQKGACASKSGTIVFIKTIFMVYFDCDSFVTLFDVNA
jgi:hypothetical protein